jgi:hypothetical protein
MNDPKASASARAMAADRILDRTYGKAPQAIGIVPIQGRSVEQLTDAELEAIIAGVQPAPSEQVEREAEQLLRDVKMMN